MSDASTRPIARRLSRAPLARLWQVKDVSAENLVLAKLCIRVSPMLRKLDTT